MNRTGNANNVELIKCLLETNENIILQQLKNLKLTVILNLGTVLRRLIKIKANKFG